MKSSVKPVFVKLLTVLKSFFLFFWGKHVGFNYKYLMCYLLMVIVFFNELQMTFCYSMNTGKAHGIIHHLTLIIAQFKFSQ